MDIFHREKRKHRIIVITIIYSCITCNSSSVHKKKRTQLSSHNGRENQDNQRILKYSARSFVNDARLGYRFVRLIENLLSRLKRENVPEDFPSIILSSRRRFRIKLIAKQTNSLFALLRLMQLLM